MTAPYDEVPADQLPADAVLLDVREDDEWDAGHAPGATHVPLAEVPQRLDEIPDGDPVYVVCRGGGRSARAAMWLASQGFPAVNVGGGMIAWQAAGRPMESDSADAPSVL